MMKSNIFMMAGIIISIAACGSENHTASYLKLASGVFSRSSENQEKITPQGIRNLLTPELIDKFQGAPLLIVSMEDLAVSSILYGVGKNQDIVTYFTPDQVSLSFRDGMLVATRGLGFDLMVADISEHISNLRSNNGVIMRTHKTLSGDDTLMTHLFVCEVIVQSNLVYAEQCEGQGSSFQNTYEFDSYGLIVKSRQWVSPERGYIVVESL